MILVLCVRYIVYVIFNVNVGIYFLVRNGSNLVIG